MPESSSPFWRRVVGTGAALGGLAVGLTAARRWIRRDLPPPSSLRPALDWTSGTLETKWGRAHYYERPGAAPPIVLVHSFNAVASSVELRPVAQHLADTTNRRLLAMDWLGFGRSDRPVIDYRPAVYQRQLFRVLTDVLDGPADLVALSLGAEYAAWAGLQAAPRVRRLALVSPTGLTSDRGPSTLGRLGLAVAGRTGLFELLYYRLTRPSSLLDFYARQIFLDPDAIPDALIEYARATAHVRGAHHAPRRFVDGSLYLRGNVADEVYSRLYRPTLLLTPETPGPTVQQFDLLPRVLDRNPQFLRHETLPGGLMPHWEAPEAFAPVLDAFLSGD